MTSKSDLEKAREIVSSYRARGGKFVGNIKGHYLEDNVAACVARGIAFGRKEGFALAAQRVQKALSEEANSN